MEIKFIDEKIERFIRSLEKSTIAKVLRTIDLLERFGNELRMPHSKHVSDKIFELRIRGKQDIRLLYAFYDQTVVILRGFVKKSSRLPSDELRAANNKLKQLDTL
jgi:hypothetical protein